MNWSPSQRCQVLLVLTIIHICYGKSTLKSLQETRQHKIYKPQPSSSDVAIHLRDIDESSDAPGVYSCPSGNGTQQLRHMIAKANNCHLKCKQVPLPLTRSWTSFTYSSFFRQIWHVQLMCYFSLTFCCLPLLGINSNVWKEWHPLPTANQCLCLPQMSLEKLQQHWGKRNGTVIL